MGKEMPVGAHESGAKYRLAGCLATVCLAALFATAQTTARAGGVFATGVTQAQEIEDGRQADAGIEKLYLLNLDAQKNAWVSRVGHRLIAFSDRPDLSYGFRILDDPTINAFSVPGYIYISSGLLDMIASDPNRDAELAGVIAHEMGHIGGRHIAKELQAQQNPVLGMLAGWVAKGKCDITSDLGPDLYLLGHDSDDENDADRRAVDTLMRAGVDPNGLASFYKKLVANQGRTEVLYLETHPNVPARLELIQQRIADNRAHGVPQAED